MYCIEYRQGCCMTLFFSSGASVISAALLQFRTIGTGLKVAAPPDIFCISRRQENSSDEVVKL